MDYKDKKNVKSKGAKDNNSNIRLLSSDNDSEKKIEDNISGKNENDVGRKSEDNASR